jgi:SSS family solute:Na+ symporter
MLGFALHHNHVEIAGKVFAIPMKTFADGTVALNGDAVFPTLVRTILPVGFRGLVVAGMVAALMSSLASLFNSVSTLFTMDVYMKLRPAASPQRQVCVGRLTTVVMTLLGILWLPVMKAIANGVLYQYLMAVQSFLAPPIVAVFVGGLVWKRMNLRGAIWGLCAGFAAGMAKLAVNVVSAGSSGFLGRIAAFQDYYFSGVQLALSTSIIVVASLTAPAPDSVHLTGLCFARLDEKFRAENRASWGWKDVVASIFIVSLVLCAYAYFTTWIQ